MCLAVQQRERDLSSCRVQGELLQDYGDIGVPRHPLGPVATASFTPEPWNSEVGYGCEAPTPIVVAQVPPPLQPVSAGLPAGGMGNPALCITCPSVSQRDATLLISTAWATEPSVLFIFL